MILYMELESISLECQKEIEGSWNQIENFSKEGKLNDTALLLIRNKIEVVQMIMERIDERLQNEGFTLCCDLKASLEKLPKDADTNPKF